MNKTLVELDLIGYSERARELAEQLNPEVLRVFEEQIRNFVAEGLREIDHSYERTVRRRNGDNAFLIFERPADAHHFACAVHRITARHNSGKTFASAHCWFRIGIATGQIVGEGQETTGIPFIDVVRLEAGGKRGHVLVDRATYSAVPPEIQKCYGPEETIRDKSGYAHQIRRCIVVVVPESAVPSPVASSFRADISRVLKYAPAELIGREKELKLLHDAWLVVRGAECPRPHIVTFVALGGEGKTSLVTKWAAELAAQDWPGCDAVFAWSFYSQGTREQLAASSDLFLKEALVFFGDDADKQFAASPAGAFEKGQRLARILGQRRSLLILDGLEPLQYAPTSPTPGQLKDQGIAALLKGLATASHGLCVVTTRYSLPDLKTFWQTTAPEVKLLRLSREAGVHLLKNLGVNGTAKEFETLVEDVKGHALTLTLLGGFLKRAFHGDIRQRDRVKFEKADEKMDGGHAFRTMAAYEQWLLRDGGDEGRREVAVLRLMGLFDRPADAGCLAALRSETIPGLTEPLAGLADDDWEFCLSGLEAAKLLTVNRDASGALISLDAHPHLREYFARQLRTQQPDAWRAAHRRLYEHLCATVSDKKSQPTLEDLQPLCQAIAHGCYAEQDQEAFSIVYRKRINRGKHHYLVNGLGASNTEFSLLSCFFKNSWEPPRNSLDADSCIHLLRQIGLALRATGKLKEAVAPLVLGFNLCERANDRDQSVNIARHIAQTHLIFGDVEEAKDWASRSVCILDDRVGNFDKVAAYAGLAHVLHCQNDFRGALENFEEAMRIQGAHDPSQPVLAGLQRHRYCDLLMTLRRYDEAIRLSEIPFERSDGAVFLAAEALASIVRARALMAINFVGFADEISAILRDAVQGLRNSGRDELLIAGLLPSAEFFCLKAQSKSAKCDLDEAWEIAERGPMKLFLADIHLHRARLFFREKEYPKAWISPQADLAAAEKLINDCGYHRRDKELADAKKAILGA